MIKINQNVSQGPSFRGKNGYAVLELLFYVALFAVLSLAVIDAMMTMAKSFKETAVQAELTRSGTILERMTREIRAAYEINPASASDDLMLEAKDAEGADKTVEFKFANPNIQFWDAGVNLGNLNAPDIAVAGLFTQITTAKGKAVRIFLTVRSNNDRINRSFDFYDTIVLRGGY